MSYSSSVTDYCRSANPATKRPRDTAQRLIRRLQTMPVLLHPLPLNYYFHNGSNVPTTESRNLHISSSTNLRTKLSSSTSLLSSPLSSVAEQMKMTNSREVMNGLTCHDLLILAGDAVASFHSNATMSYCLHLSAIHAVQGGKVIHCCAPGSKSINMRELIELIECECLRTCRRQHEQQTLERNQSEWNYASESKKKVNNGSNLTEEFNTLEEDNYIKECQAQVISALQHVRVITCDDLTDLELFCHYFTLEETFDSKCSKNNTQDNDGEAQHIAAIQNSTAENVCHESFYNKCSGAHEVQSITPLVFVHDAIGKNSYLYQYERSAGEEVPVLRWLLAALQRRIHCALIITESLSCSIDEPTIHITHSVQSINAREENTQHTKLKTNNTFLFYANGKKIAEQQSGNVKDFVSFHNKYNSNLLYSENKSKCTALDQILHGSDFVHRFQSLLTSQQSINEYNSHGNNNAKFVRNYVNCNTLDSQLVRNTHVRRSIADTIAEEKIRKISLSSSSSSSSLSVPRSLNCHPSAFDTCTGKTELTHSVTSPLSLKYNSVERVVDTYTESTWPWESNIHRANIDVESLRIHCLCVTLCTNHTEYQEKRNNFKTLHKWFVNGHLFRLQLLNRTKLNQLRNINVNSNNYNSIISSNSDNSSHSKNRRWGKTGMNVSKEESKLTGEYLCSTQLLESDSAKITHYTTLMELSK